MNVDAHAELPGRVCPLRYRYGPQALRDAHERATSTLYVVGGLYGNLPALDTVQAMASAEVTAPTLCFNGDFNWFNCDDAGFDEVNRRVLAHDATLGNVEAELGSDADDAGCGCAYPDAVDAQVVQRSNAIHARLKTTAARHPQVLVRLAALPMLARYRVGDCRVGVVHGDADSLAGWRFDPGALDDPSLRGWRESAFATAEVDLFASTHTCLPALRSFALPSGTCAAVANNGAAGMPNFAGDLCGLCVRVGLTPSPHEVVHELRLAGTYVALLPVRYDTTRWEQLFLANWPAGSPAWTSYFPRIGGANTFQRRQVLPLAG